MCKAASLCSTYDRGLSPHPTPRRRAAVRRRARAGGQAGAGAHVGRQEGDGGARQQQGHQAVHQPGGRRPVALAAAAAIRPAAGGVGTEADAVRAGAGAAGVHAPAVAAGEDGDRGAGCAGGRGAHRGRWDGACAAVRLL
eukprot:6540902-Prymnesium_polylepis.1